MNGTLARIAWLPAILALQGCAHRGLRVYDAHSGLETTQEKAVAAIADSDIVVLGEEHYDRDVQNAEAAIIDAVVKESRAQGDFAVGWEFLNVSSRTETEGLWQAFVKDQITAENFLRRTQKSKNPSYAPVLETIKWNQGVLFGVNLSRKEKEPIVKGGIAAADRKLVPRDFALGGTAYFERFKKEMQTHEKAEELSNFFAAQSLTDDVMADHLLGDSDASLKFLITGGFHAAYFDGVVRRIHVRAPDATVTSIELVDAAELTEAKLKSELQHLQYGAIADFVFFVRAPAVAGQSRK